MSDKTVKMYEGHLGEMQGVHSYGDHCKFGKRACVPGSLETGVVNGTTYLLQDYIKRGICEVNVDEWDDRILIQVIVYDDVVEQRKYKTVRDMFPSTALKATRDNKTWEELSKPINTLVELGSKDSVEYKNSEEYRKEQANKTEKQRMDTEKEWIVSQVRLVYDYAIAQLEKASENRTLVGRHVLDQIVAGLWLVVKDTLGDGFSMDKKVREREEHPSEDALEEMDPREDGLVEEKKEWPRPDPSYDELGQSEKKPAEFLEEKREADRQEYDGSVEMVHK